MPHHDGCTLEHRPRMILTLLVAFLPGCGDDPVGPQRSLGEMWASSHMAAIGSLRGGGVLGNSLPGTWRPFDASSPWNTPIAPGAPKHPDSDAIIAHMVSKANTLEFANSYTIPIWVVDAAQMQPVAVRSDRIFDWWDPAQDGWSDIGVPITRDMWPEQTSDAHICVVDPEWGVAWEMSRFDWPDGETPSCTTFNIWALRGSGHGNPNEGFRWGARGGRGSGFPIIAGLLRPEEIEVGEIRHALVFTFSEIRMADDGSNLFLWPPACRADGDVVGHQYPIEGMRLQLDPAANESDFAAWHLTPEARVVARALQTYGMFLGDRGGDMKIQVQLLAKEPNKHRRMWDSRLPGLYRAIERIPTNRLRVVYTGEPTIKAD